MNGIINIYKEKGFTSHDVVAKMRGILRTKKIGHTGTLDPEAEGVLPVCVGMATKLCEVFTDHDKEYACVMQLGISTDTEDITGKVLETKEYSDITLERVMEVLASFVGPYEQIPPMYSAIKVNGKKLYELAREGKVIERTPRSVEIHRIYDVKALDAPGTYSFVVHCSKGTYIRSLCRDVGERLGTVACMKELTRTRMGNFNLDQALTLQQLEAIIIPVREMGDEAMTLAMGEHLLDFETIFAKDLKARVNENGHRYLINGNPLAKEDFLLEDWENFEKVSKSDAFLCVLDIDGSLTGLYMRKQGKDKLFPYKMFIGSHG